MATNSQSDSDCADPLGYIHPDILAALRHLDLSGRVAFNERRIVSSGSYGDIARGDCHSNQGKIKVAVKRLRFYLMEDIKLLFEKEIYVWSKLKHPNILPLLGFTFDDSTGYPLLVSEWMEHGSAWNYVNVHRDCDVTRIIIGAARGLAYLHDNGVVHSDVKSDNILVSQSGDALICDFGCARMATASRSLAKPSNGAKGTTRYLAYELLVHQEPDVPVPTYSDKADVWAFGMTVYELLTRERPYPHLREANVLLAVMRGELPSRPTSLDTVRPDDQDTLWGVCQRCWDHDPNTRITMSGVCAVLEGRDDEATPTDPQNV